MGLLPGLDVCHPIIQAPMAGVTTPALAAAVSEAGALGSLGLGAASAERARQEIRAVRAQTGRSFNVNLFCHTAPRSDAATRRAWIDHLAPYFRAEGAEPPDDLNDIYAPIDENAAMREVVLAERPPVVSFHFGVPGRALIDAIHDYGGIVALCATTPAEAQIAVSAGADLLVAQGMEAGGHRGNFDANHDLELGLIPLVRAVVAHHDLPVIAAGGLMDGASIHAVCQLGAAGAQLGTAFVACPESAATPADRAVLRGARQTALTRCISGRPARGVRGPFQGEIATGAPAVPDYPLTYDAAKQLHAAARTNDDPRYAPNWAGQGVAAVRATPAAELVATLARESEIARGRHP